jgi:hypothetical protein
MYFRVPVATSTQAYASSWMSTKTGPVGLGQYLLVTGDVRFAEIVPDHLSQTHFGHNNQRRNLRNLGVGHICDSQRS